MKQIHKLAAAIATFACICASQNVYAQTFAAGDVLISVGNSHIKWFHHDGTYVTMLDNTSGSSETVGLYVDPSGNLYDAEWTTSTMSKFDLTGTLVTHPWGSGLNEPWQVVGDGAGNIYVDNQEANQLLKFNASGTLLASWNPPGSTIMQGMDLASDGRTMYYIGQNGIKRFDVVSGSQLSTFTTSTHFLYHMRVLPDGGAVATDLSTNQVHRYNSAGSLVQSYTEPDGEAWAAISLDPDGLSFWGLDYSSGRAHQIRLSDGAELSMIDAQSEGSATGMTVVGEHATPPVVTTDPVNQSICSGGNATFTSAATGTSPNVQWQRSTDNGSSWAAVSGATSSTLAFAATTANTGQQFRAIYTNGAGADTTSAATLTVGALPTISVSLSSTLLWPANHTMYDITATVTTTGCTGCGGLTVTLASLTSNEADNGVADGDTPNDIQNASVGTDDRAFSVRAERSARGSGRTYTATYQVADCAGNTATASATVTVPRTH